MKASGTSLGIVLCMGVLVLASTSGCKDEQASELRIGWIGPLSGDVAIYGKMVQRGSEVAVDEINARGGIDGKLLRVIYEDDQLQPQKGVSAIRKLIDVDRVPVVIQAIGSSVMLAEAPIAEERKVVLISPTCTSDAIRDAGDYIFRTAPRDSEQGKVIAELARRRFGQDKVGVLYINNAYGAGLKSRFVDSFTTLGGSIATEEAFLPGTTDFRAQLLRNKNTGVELVALFGHYREAGLVLRQARELDLRIQFIGADGCFAPDLIDLAKNAAEGFVVTNLGWKHDSTEPIVRNFVDRFRKKYGKAPEVFSAYGYDCVHVVARAIEAANQYRGEDIKKALYGLRDIPGVTGVTTFDEHGEVEKSFQVYIVRNGAFEVLP